MQSRETLSDLLSPIQRHNLSIWLKNLRIKMVSAVYWKNKSPWSVEKRTVQDQFLLMPVKGNFRAKLKTSEFVVKPKEVLFVQMEEPHELAIEECENLEQIALHFYVQDFCHKDFDMRIFRNHFKLSNFNFWQERFKRLVHVLNHDFEEGCFLGSILLKEYFIADLLEIPHELNLPQIIDTRLKVVLDYIGRHFSDANLSNDDLVKVAGLKDVQLRRIFIKNLGLAPKDFIVDFRIEEACKLLRGTELSIKEIAYKVGFSQSDYFYHVFRKIKKKTPTKYRIQFYSGNAQNFYY